MSLSLILNYFSCNSTVLLQPSFNNTTNAWHTYHSNYVARQIDLFCQDYRISTCIYDKTKKKSEFEFKKSDNWDEYNEGSPHEHPMPDTIYILEKIDNISLLTDQGEPVTVSERNTQIAKFSITLELKMGTTSDCENPMNFFLSEPYNVLTNNAIKIGDFYKSDGKYKAYTSGYIPFPIKKIAKQLEELDTDIFYKLNQIVLTTTLVSPDGKHKCVTQYIQPVCKYDDSDLD